MSQVSKTLWLSSLPYPFNAFFSSLKKRQSVLRITAIMERMAGDVEKREVSTGGNGREAESERVIPGRVIISTTQRQDVMLSGGLSRLNE
jgi:hypothetical protein